MRILILGSGGREHALAWGILQEDPEAEVILCPGNGGTEGNGGAGGTGRALSTDGRAAGAAGMRNIPGDLGEVDSLVEMARGLKVDLTVVGPEGPLVAGVADRFQRAGLPVFGPSARAAALEGSKVFAKTLMRECGVPTAGFEVYASAEKARAAVVRGEFPKVLKADGLAAGKGVVIAEDEKEGLAAVREIMEDRRFGEAGNLLLMESFLQGEEVSVFALARDEEYRLLPAAQDHKKIGENDTGPNTGGMGAVAPVAGVSDEMLRRVGETVFAPILRAMVKRGTPFRGLLYAGLIMVKGEPQVLEFNCRFGDPETQVVVPLLCAGFTEALVSVAQGGRSLPQIRVRAGAAATVILASSGYPGSYRSGFPIAGLEEADQCVEAFVFHAGTKRQGNQVLTSGGRVLAVTGRGPDLCAALDIAYGAAAVIEFEGKTLRRDIGHKGLGFCPKESRLGGGG